MRLVTKGTAFQHEAFFYANDEEFLEGTAAFLREGAEAGEPALAVLAAPKIQALRSELGSQSGAVHFADMAEVGSKATWAFPVEKVDQPVGNVST